MRGRCVSDHVVRASSYATKLNYQYATKQYVCYITSGFDSAWWIRKKEVLPKLSKLFRFNFLHRFSWAVENDVMARIFSLANELLASIFKHLNGIELAIVARTCQRFHDASLIDQIWQHLCFRGKFYNTVMSSANLESVKEYTSGSRSE